MFICLYLRSNSLDYIPITINNLQPHIPFNLQSITYRPKPIHLHLAGLCGWDKQENETDGAISFQMRSPTGVAILPPFAQEEVVWAKVAGFPWWPARINALPSHLNTHYRVHFLADSTQYPGGNPAPSSVGKK